MLAGELDTAADLLEEALRPLPGPDWADTVIHIYGRLATTRADTGELERAERTVAEAERYVEDHSLDELPSMTLVHVARRKLLEQRRDTAAARALAREARDVLASCPDPGVLHELLATTERALELTSPRQVAGVCRSTPN